MRLFLHIKAVKIASYTNDKKIEKHYNLNDPYLSSICNLPKISFLRYFFRMSPSSNKIVVFITIFVVICALGFGIYACVEYVNRNNYESSDYVCGSFANITSMTMDKQIWDVWHWTYASEYGSFEQKCPTFAHDANIYRNGRLAMITDGKLLSIVSRTELKDCHGNVAYVLETGDFFQTMINGNRIWVELLLKYTNDTIIAYVTSKIFFVGSIDFTSPNGQTIARAAKTIDGAHWKWTYNLFTTEIDMAPIIAATAKISFSPAFGEKDDKNDMCNQFFLGAGITAVILLGILFVAGIVFVIAFFQKNRCCKSPQDSYP